MTKRLFICFAYALLVLGPCGVCFSAEIMTLWPEDIHTKIFTDTKPGTAGELQLKAARNEYESGQFGVHAPVRSLSVVLSVSSLKHKDGTSEIPKENIRLRPIGSIPIKENTSGADKIVIRKAPCEIPDVLFESQKFIVKKGESKGVWVTVFVPENAKSGEYRATVTLVAGSVRKSFPICLEVFSFTLPSERHLWVTNWHNSHYIARAHDVPLWSEKFWPVLGTYFKNMAEHRQNVILTTWIPDGKFVKATRKIDGSWDFDFSNLERYLRLAEQYGLADRIEFSFCGSINQQKNIIQFQNAFVHDEKAGKTISVGFDEWCKPVLGALEKMLIETNRIDRAMVHVADEPFFINMDRWRAASKKVHEAAPRIRRIDAIESINFSDELEVWVPKLTHFDRWREAYEARRADGEFWFYICCHPIGDTYPNRFMDLPATRNRVIHWINFTEHLAGYLRCGYNSWHVDPFGPPITKFAPGDTHAVYPGPIDSIRWEIDREGLEDYEYLVLLRDLTAKLKKESKADLWWLIPERRSIEIGRRVVRSISDTELDPKKIAAARLEVARQIEKFSAQPPLIIQTYPKDNSRVFAGPVVIEVYGMTARGATVTVNGKPTPVRDDGTFLSSDWNETTHQLEVISTLNGKTTKAVRNFYGK